MPARRPASSGRQPPGRHTKGCAHELRDQRWPAAISLTKVRLMDTERVAAVRRFNRTVTQRVGALDDEYMARGRPLGQARLLWEIGPTGAEVAALRGRLGLDSGYTSRLLRALEADGLVT